MATVKTELERRLYGALRRIAREYRSSTSLLKTGDAGLSGVEALEYAYDNILQEAKNAIHGVRIPALPKDGGTRHG